MYKINKRMFETERKALEYWSKLSFCDRVISHYNKDGEEIEIKLLVTEKSIEAYKNSNYSYEVKYRGSKKLYKCNDLDHALTNPKIENIYVKDNYGGFLLANIYIIDNKKISLKLN